MRYQFEFDPENKILLLRFEGQLTDSLMKELYWEIRKYSTATDALAGIWDFSLVTEWAVSPELIHDLSNRAPAMPDATTRPRFFVAPAMVGSAISRLYELAGGHKNPLLKIVRSLEEALAELGVQSPHFEPLE
jgi:hypothetical protein